MEYQDYNDEFHRYRTDGYEKTVRERRRYYERIIRNYKLEERINKEHINENKYRMTQLGEKIKKLEKELHKMEINQEDRTKVSLINQNGKARDLVQSANEREIIRANIRYLKHNDRQMKKWIRGEQQKISKLVIF